MPKFIYEAKKGPRETIKASLEADTLEAAVNQLNEKGFFPIYIKEEKITGDENSSGRVPLLRLRKKIRAHDLSTFTRQLADLLESGLTLFRALNIVGRQTENELLRKIIQDLHRCLKDGQTLSEALKKHPKVFSGFYVSMIKSGEVGGVLEKTLSQLSDFTEKQEELRAKLRAALAYPAIMALVGLITIFTMLTFVVPRLATMFKTMGQTLPWSTRTLIQTSHYLRDYWWMIITVGLFVFFFLKRKTKTREGKFALDGFKLKMPLIGNLIRKTEIAQFSSTLATLLDNGVPMLLSLRAASETIRNELLKREIEAVYKKVEEGEKLGKSLEESHHFPNFVTNMIIVGEEGSLLGRSLYKVSGTYARDADRTVKMIMSLLEPIMILIMGGIAMFIAISMLLPIFQFNLMVS